MDSAELVEERSRIEAAQKDPARFADLYDAYFDRIYAFVAGRVRNRVEAQDITSDVFHQALASLRKYEWRGLPFSAWLYRIAINAMNDHHQRTSRERGDAKTAPEPATREIEHVEERATLYRLVDSLPADQRRVVVMRFAEERSIAEVAKELGRSEGAIKQLQWRAMQTLRARVGQNHG